MLNNLVFDRTENDVAQKTDKGLYRYTDLNRVCTAVRSIFSRYHNAGYSFPVYLIYGDYNENAIPRANDMRLYLYSVTCLRGHIAMPDSYALPATMDELDYKGANEIERFLYDSDRMLDGIEAAWFYCDEVYSDEVDM